MYAENNIVKVAKRDNNPKRKYLVLNTLQGKHMSAEPKEALKMYKALAEKVKEGYGGDSVLFVGFAETATAIGTAVAAEFDAFYMQTTREIIPGEEYLYFSEEHSHATEQKLVRGYLEKNKNQIKHIIFVEDEVTTGKTILNIVNILKKEFPDIKSYSVASLLNGMDESAILKYQEMNIDLLYLIKTNHADYDEIVESYKGDGICHELCTDKPDESIEVTELNYGDYINPRCGVNSLDYVKHVDNLCSKILKKIDIIGMEKILVMGTEELMYPAIYMGSMIDSAKVYTHSTTRSPISPGTENDYPIRERYELRSLYDSDRRTFIYDIGEYDCVIVITDASDNEKMGMFSLINALGNKNKKIYIVRWC